MNRYHTGLLLFLIFLGIYTWGSFARIPFGDGVAFAHMVETGKYITTATATSHFLYVNICIFIKNVFSISAIDANKTLIILSAAATVSFVYFSIDILTKKTLPSVIGAIVFGFSFSFWKNAEILEVYTLNALIISIFLYFTIKSFIDSSEKSIFLSGLFLGISLWAHIQNVLFIPAFLLFIYYFKNNRKWAGLSLAMFVLLFSSLFILNTVQGLPLNSPYSSGQGSWVENSFKKTATQYSSDFVKSILYLIYNFTIFIFFAFVGIKMLFKENKKMFYTFFLASLCVYGFATFYAVSDNYVFFIPFNLIFAIAIGYGISFKNVHIFKTAVLALMIPLFYVSCYKLAFFSEKAKEFNDFKSYKGGLEFYLLPWMNTNKGIIEFVIDKKESPETNWMKEGTQDYINFLKSKGHTEKEIRKL